MRRTSTRVIEAITRDGYVVAQEYLPATAKGDVRAVPHERAAAGVSAIRSIESAAWGP
jgi:glutathione synthase/RimK-type ligase-like ATP-grasp enzyme